MRRITILFLLLLVYVMTNAQLTNSSYTPEERANFQTEWMKANLSLNEQQITLIESINLEYAQKMEKVKQINGKVAKLKEAQKISDEKDEKLAEMLSRDQFKIYLDKKKELLQHVKAKMNEEL